MKKGKPVTYDGASQTACDLDSGEPVEYACLLIGSNKGGWAIELVDGSIRPIKLTRHQQARLDERWSKPLPSFFQGLPASLETRACSCVGPQNGNPVCPCMMPAHVERETQRRKAELFDKIIAGNKPRVRVPCNSRPCPASPT